jgi:hypothetical protein
MVRALGLNNQIMPDIMETTMKRHAHSYIRFPRATQSAEN